MIESKYTCDQCGVQTDKVFHLTLECYIDDSQTGGQIAEEEYAKFCSHKCFEKYLVEFLKNTFDENTFNEIGRSAPPDMESEAADNDDYYFG